MHACSAGRVQPVMGAGRGTWAGHEGMGCMHRVVQGMQGAGGPCSTDWRGEGVREWMQACVEAGECGHLCGAAQHAWQGHGRAGWRGGVQQGRHRQHHTAHGTEQGQRKGSVRAARMNGVHGNRPCGGWGGRGTVRPAGARDRACAHGAMEVGRRDAVQAGRRDRKCGGMSVGGSRRHRWGDGCGACVRMDAGHINNDAGQAQVQGMGIPSGVCRNRTDWAQADGGRVVLARGVGHAQSNGHARMRCGYRLCMLGRSTVTEARHALCARNCRWRMQAMQNEHVPWPADGIAIQHVITDANRNNNQIRRGK